MPALVCVRTHYASVVLNVHDRNKMFCTKPGICCTTVLLCTEKICVSRVAFSSTSFFFIKTKGIIRLSVTKVLRGVPVKKGLSEYFVDSDSQVAWRLAYPLGSGSTTPGVLERENRLCVSSLPDFYAEGGIAITGTAAATAVRAGRRTLLWGGQNLRLTILALHFFVFDTPPP